MKNYGMRNEMDLQLKRLHRTVQFSRFFWQGFRTSSARGVAHSKAQSARCGATAQLMHLALAGPSLRRKRHESVMSFVMGRGLKR